MVKHDRNHSDFYICKVNWILAPFVWSALNIPNFLPDESWIELSDIQSNVYLCTPSVECVCVLIIWGTDYSTIMK